MLVVPLVGQDFTWKGGHEPRSEDPTSSPAVSMQTLRPIMPAAVITPSIIPKQGPSPAVAMFVTRGIGDKILAWPALTYII